MEVLADEQRDTTVGFLAQAVGWFGAQGITCRRVLTDNGFSYRSIERRKTCNALDFTSIRTRPHTTRAYRKVGGLIKILLVKWAYAIACRTSEA